MDIYVEKGLNDEIFFVVMLKFNFIYNGILIEKGIFL